MTSVLSAAWGPRPFSRPHTGACACWRKSNAELGLAQGAALSARAGTAAPGRCGRAGQQEGNPRGWCSLTSRLVLVRDADPSRPFRLASKYPRRAKRLFSIRGLWEEVVALAGSVALAGTLGLADYLLDLVETSRTVGKNGLEVLATWLSVAPYFVTSRGVWETAGDEVKAVASRLGGGL